MNKFFQIMIVALVAVSLSSCGKRPPPSSGGTSGGDPTTPTTKGGEDPPPAPPSGEAPPVGTATIKGKVMLNGTPPKMPTLAGIDGKPECADQHDVAPTAEVIVVDANNALANTFVYISKGVKGKYPPPAEPKKVDQAKCIYVPHVVGIQAGQTLEVTNSDPTLHNVHVLPSPALRDTNKAQPKGSPAIKLKFRKAQVPVTVKCDVHPWMLAYACVVEHPFYGVTGADGSFTFPSTLPAGTYTVTAWHEKLGEVTQDVTIGDGATEEISFEFKS